MLFCDRDVNATCVTFPCSSRPVPDGQGGARTPADGRVFADAALRAAGELPGRVGLLGRDEERPEAAPHRKYRTNFTRLRRFRYLNFFDRFS